MAIQMRRGYAANFDASKMLAGEWAVTIDPETQNQIVYMCFGAGIVKRMGTLEDLEDWLIVQMIPYTDEFENIKNQCRNLYNQILVIRDSLIPAAQIALQVPDLVDEAKLYRDETKAYKEYVDNMVDIDIPKMFLDAMTGILYYDGGKINFGLDYMTGNLMWELI